MSRAVAIGDERLLAGYGLVGVEVFDAPDLESARTAWRSVGSGVALVLLTANAHEALRRELAEEQEVIWAVLPS